MPNKIVALLPMKSNSERLPNKNIMDMCNKPLFYHVLDELIKCRNIERIIINTDSPKIIEFCEQDYPNVECIERPNALCGDYVEMNEIIKYDILNLEAEHFIQTHSTNPLLTEKSITDAIALYFKNLNKFDSLFSVNKIQTRLFSHSIRPINHNQGELIRTQDLKPIYEENSNFYIFSQNSFISARHNRIGQKPNV